MLEDNVLDDADFDDLVLEVGEIPYQEKNEMLWLLKYHYDIELLEGDLQLIAREIQNKEGRQKYTKSMRQRLVSNSVFGEYIDFIVAPMEFNVKRTRKRSVHRVWCVMGDGHVESFMVVYRNSSPVTGSFRDKPDEYNEESRALITAIVPKYYDAVA